MTLIEIHNKVRHVGTIFRVVIVNLTDQNGPKRVEAGTNEKKMTQCFIFLFANETKAARLYFSTKESLHSAQDFPSILPGYEDSRPNQGTVQK